MSSPLFKPSNSILKIQLNESTDIVHTLFSLIPQHYSLTLFISA